MKGRDMKKLYRINVVAAAWILVCSVAIHTQQHITVMAMGNSGEARARLASSFNNGIIRSFAGGRRSNLCLEAQRFTPVLADCNGDVAEQRWDFGDDGSLRPSQNPSMCLTANDLSQGNDILILPCGDPSLSDIQTWKIWGSGSLVIESVATGLAIDVATVGVPQEIIIWTYNGGNNQKWGIPDFQPEIQSSVDQI